MLIGKNLSLFRILKITWKVDLLMVAFCSLVYTIDTLLLVPFKLPIAFPALMGTAIAFFIGFNNNQAYDRWWEARRVWGEIVNDSRSWARNLIAYNQNPGATKRMIYRHIGFLYALTATLRRNEDKTHLEFLTQADIKELKLGLHIPNTLLRIQAQELKQLRTGNNLTDFEFYNLNGLLQNFCDEMGKSERINNTVYPISYVFFTKLFIWLFVALITMSTNNEVGWPAIVLGWLMGFVFNTIHLNGMSLMNPFEYAPAGIPILSITRNIEINLLQELNDEYIPEPLPPINDEYIL